MNSMNERLNFAKDKSFACAVNVLADCRSIQNEFKEDVLAKQLLRFGMPIAEKLEERVGSFKCKDFYYKLPLECKKAGESNHCNRWRMEYNFLAKKGIKGSTRCRRVTNNNRCEIKNHEK